MVFLKFREKVQCEKNSRRRNQCYDQSFPPVPCDKIHHALDKLFGQACLLHIRNKRRRRSILPILNSLYRLSGLRHFNIPRRLRGLHRRRRLTRLRFRRALRIPRISRRRVCSRKRIIAHHRYLGRRLRFCRGKSERVQGLHIRQSYGRYIKLRTFPGRAVPNIGNTGWKHTLRRIGFSEMIVRGIKIVGSGYNAVIGKDETAGGTFAENYFVSAKRTNFRFSHILTP